MYERLPKFRKLENWGHPDVPPITVGINYLPLLNFEARRNGGIQMTIDEMLDIIDCNCFRHYDAGYEVDPTAVKRFWLNHSSAITFGNTFIKGNFAGAGEDSFFVVKATLSAVADKTIASQLGGTNPGDTFIGPGSAVGINYLPLLNFEARRNGGIQMTGEY